VPWYPTASAGTSNREAASRLLTSFETG